MPSLTRLLTPTAHITFHQLSMRHEGEEVILWRKGSDTFLAIPPIGGQAIRLLQQQYSIQQTEHALSKEYGGEVELSDLLNTLLEEGLIATIDAWKIPEQRSVDQNSLSFIKQKHIAWIFTWPVGILYAGILIAAALSVLRHPSVVPSEKDFFWTNIISLTVLSNILLGLIIGMIHEYGHLFAARAFGVRGTFRFGTRLQYLVLQTDVTGLWAVSRDIRFFVYLAGMMVELLIVAIAILLLAYGHLPILAMQLLKVIILLIFFGILSECEVFMRTDIYFVLMDVLRCRNLFGDAMAYFRYLLQKGWELFQKKKRRRINPLEVLPAHERKSVILYMLIAILGSAVTLVLYVFFGIPIIIGIYREGFAAIEQGMQTQDILTLLNGSITVLLEGGFFLIFLVTFLRSHPQVFTGLQNLRRYTTLLQGKKT